MDNTKTKETDTICVTIHAWDEKGNHHADQFLLTTTLWDYIMGLEAKGIRNEHFAETDADIYYSLNEVVEEALDIYIFNLDGKTLVAA